MTDLEPGPALDRWLGELQVAGAVFRSQGLPAVITPANDGVHALTSLHYDGRAVDIRSKSISAAATKRWVAREIREALGTDFDVILEREGEDQEHIHIEWQPRRRL